MPSKRAEGKHQEEVRIADVQKCAGWNLGGGKPLLGGANAAGKYQLRWVCLDADWSRQKVLT